MINDFLVFKSCLENNNIKVANIFLDQVLKKYTLLQFSENVDISNMRDIYQNMKESKEIIINEFKDENQHEKQAYFVICFKETIIIFEHSYKSYLQNFLSNKQDLIIHFLSDSKKLFDDNITIQYKESVSSNFLNSLISTFQEKFIIRRFPKPSFKKIWEIIKSCVTTFLIKQSFHKLNKNRISNYESNSNIRESINQNEYIELDYNICGSSFTACLMYHIIKEELLIIKKPRYEKQKLVRREIDNYSKICHPFLPKFYGVCSSNPDFFVIEYIYGQTLSNIHKIDLSIDDQITIIFELMLVLEYLHRNHFIYRDLKPNNVIVDGNKDIVLIDFDRMVDFQYLNDNADFTADLGSRFVAPEIGSNDFTYKCDVYSLGKMIYCIMKKERSVNDENSNQNVDFGEYNEILKIYKKCVLNDPNERPSLPQLIVEFYIEYYSNIHIKNLFERFENDFRQMMDDITFNILKKVEKNGNNTETLNYLGVLFNVSKVIDHDINKSIYYFQLAADQNDPNAQFNLGSIYFQNELVPRDVNKAIMYYSQASDQGFLKAQLILGDIYYQNKYVERNLNKAIYYYSLAANQDDENAQLILGIIYEEGKYVEKDIQKAIYYYSQAVNHNVLKAELRLGLIYYSDHSISNNIKKAISCLSLAANQNDPGSQYVLGTIYSEDNEEHDINKAIHYLTLSANQKYNKALFSLGNIYYQGEKTERDIKKAIYFFSIASDLDDPDSQYCLGLIYDKSSSITRDREKAIHYYTLAANQGNVEAQYNLGVIYENRDFTPIDINKALYYYSLAASQNHPKSQYKIASFYYDGQYVPYDLQKAIYYFTLSANNGNEDAQIDLAVLYYEQKEIDKAIQYWLMASDQNNPIAQYNLGQIYENGKLIPRDINKAIYYYTLSANNNYTRAQVNLAFIYNEGIHIPRDISRAIYYYSLAAANNNPIAQLNLGAIYNKGDGVNQDTKKAIYYYSLSADQGTPQAQFNLGSIYHKGQNVPRDIKKAIYYYTLAANQNFMQALHNLGHIYYQGTDVPRDMNKAIFYLTLAAYKNESKSQLILGTIFYDCTFILSNIEKGLFWLLKSSNNGNVDANFIVGFIYHEGKNVNRDIRKAIHCYKEASSFDHQYAKNNLGVIYKNGFGDEIPKNVGQAMEYFNEAIKQKNDEVAMYNLSNIYIFNESVENFQLAIELLIKSLKKGFTPSKELLFIALIKEFGSDLQNIKDEIIKYSGIQSELQDIICEAIKVQKLDQIENFNEFCELYKKKDFLYNHNCQAIETSSMLNQNEKLLKSIQKNDLNEMFYEGFGINLS